MSGRAERNTDERMEERGGPSERAFESWATTHRVAFHRFGLDGELPGSSGHTFIDHAPDYLVEGAFYEVQGTDQPTWLFKLHKLDQLKLWNEYLPVWFWLRYSPTEKIRWLPLPDLRRRLEVADSRVVIDGYKHCLLLDVGAP